MRLRDLVGQARPAAVLRNAILRDRVAHSYLFCGPEGVGKSTAARLFARMLVCEGDRADDPAAACGKCRPCQLVAGARHPDVRFLSPPSGADERSVIPVDDIRQGFVYDVHLKPVMGRRKVYIVDPAERTAHLAIHTILKVLEEPPPYVITILVTSQPASLPPTIPSRCQQVQFQLAGTNAIERHLLSMDVEPLAAASLARIAGGRTAWAIRAARRPEVLAVRSALLDLCADISAGNAPRALRLAEEIRLQAAALARAQDDNEGAEGEEEDDEPAPTGVASNRLIRSALPWCLDVVVSWYRDCIAAAEGAPLLNPDYESLLAKSSHSGLSGAERDVEAILRAKHSIQRSANIDLALESLAISLIVGGN